MIFVAIAATYTPISWLMLPRSHATFVLSVVWIGALIGVLVMIFWPAPPKRITVPLFITVGWSALLVIDELWKNLGGWGIHFSTFRWSVSHTRGACLWNTKTRSLANKIWISRNLPLICGSRYRIALHNYCFHRSTHNENLISLFHNCDKKII